MDDSNAPTQRVSRSIPDAPTSQGGTVEPANRAPVAIRTIQTPEPEPGERYELRDPFADLTYRSVRLQDMVAKADQLGANRFVVLDARDQRSFIHKVDGQWQREEPRNPQRGGQAIPRAVSSPEPNSQQTPTNVIPLPSTQKEPPAQENIYPQATARIDAQAERAALVAKLEASLLDRYLIKRADTPRRTKRRIQPSPVFDAANGSLGRNGRCDEAAVHQ